MSEIILNTPLVKLRKLEGKIQPLISCANGQVLEHEHFTDDLRGLIGALTLAIDVTAGKFYPRGFYTDKKENKILQLGGAM